MKKLRDLVAQCVLPAWRVAVLALLVSIYLKVGETNDYMPTECASGSDILEGSREAVRDLSAKISDIEYACRDR